MNYVTDLMRSYKFILISIIFVIVIFVIENRRELETSFNIYKEIKEVKCVIEEITQKMAPPSNLGLNISGPVQTGQHGQAMEIFDYYNGKKNGFFVEAGAHDGEFLSNTLFFEANCSWTGLLVEPNKASYALLETRHRAAHSINTCLSSEDIPITIEFDAADVFGGINQDFENVKNAEIGQMRDTMPENMRSRYQLKCYPLYSLLLALGNPRVDFLSLDIEGAELAVLNTVPWDKVDIELVMIETAHLDRVKIDETMLAAGYEIYKELLIDVIYRKIG